MATGLPRVFALRFRKGRLIGGGEVLDVRCVDGDVFRLVGDDDLRAAAKRLSDAPQSAEVEALVADSTWHALRVRGPASEWVAGPQSARLALEGGAWLVCVGCDRVPGWLAGLKDACDAQVIPRLLAGAVLRLPVSVEPTLQAVRPPQPVGWSEPRRLSEAPAAPAPRHLHLMAPLVLGFVVLNTVLLVLLLWFLLRAPSVPERPQLTPPTSMIAPAAPDASPPPATFPGASPSVAPSATAAPAAPAKAAPTRRRRP